MSVGEGEPVGVVAVNKPEQVPTPVPVPLVLMHAARTSAIVLILVESGVIVVAYGPVVMFGPFIVVGPEVPVPIVTRLPTCINALAMPVTFAAGAPIVHAGVPLGVMLMNCCSAVTEATVVTSLTTT